MKPVDARAKKLNETATRLMMAGNVDRYLHALRLLFTLRTRSLPLA
ncbi:MAG: hypothetical protein ACOH13_08830 [Flavobacteriales bacterium]